MCVRDIKYRVCINLIDTLSNLPIDIILLGSIFSLIYISPEKTILEAVRDPGNWVREVLVLKKE